MNPFSIEVLIAAKLDPLLHAGSRYGRFASLAGGEIERWFGFSQSVGGIGEVISTTGNACPVN
jgi:hypothetical protein